LHDRQRSRARHRHRHLRQGRPERAGRRRPADAADRRAHRWRNPRRKFGLSGVESLVERIPDGAFIALPPDHSLPAMDAVRALIRRKATGLRLLGVPVLGLSADLLIGAGCVAEVHSSAVSLGEAGLAPRFTDEAGNVWVGRRRELATLAHAARHTYVTVEEFRAGDILEDELLAPGVIGATYVSGIARAERGAWPLGVADVYAIDDAHLAAYAK